MKVINGIVIAVKMQKTVVVEVTRRRPHPLYKKLIKRSKHYKVDTGDVTVVVGDHVSILSTRPMAKGKFYKIGQVLHPGTMRAKEISNSAKQEVVKKNVEAPVEQQPKEKKSAVKPAAKGRKKKE